MLAPSPKPAHARGLRWGWGMGRPGRKRKSGAREKNGQRQRKKKAELVEERVRIARSQPHRRALRSNDRANELAESVLGRLRLTRIAAERGSHAQDPEQQMPPGLSASQYAAGELFAGAVSRYRVVIEGPRPVRSLALATGYEHLADEEEKEAATRFSCPSAHADPIEKTVTLAGKQIKVREWPCQQPGETCPCAERRAQYMRVYEAAAAAGRRALMAVIAVAVRGEELPASELVYLKAGLDALAAKFGLQGVEH